MLPCSSTKYGADVATANGVLFYQLFLGHPASIIRSDADDLLSRKLSILSVLGYHVVIVVSLCSKESVVRINASWIVATMKHIHSFWNFTIGKNP